MRYKIGFRFVLSAKGFENINPAFLHCNRVFLLGVSIVLALV